MAPRLIQIRYPDACSRCAAELVVGTKVWWDGDERTVTCLACQASGPQRATQQTSGNSPPLAGAIGEAGGSARKEYERRHQRRDQQIDQKWGRLARVVRFLSDDPQSTKAWATGSGGEQRLGKSLVERLGDRGVILQDRKVPKTRGNIDHIAIASSGVWVIDTKKYKGRVECRNRGGLFKTDYRLYVGGRDRTRLAEQLEWQVEAVRTALADDGVPIQAVVCFVDAEWKLFPEPFRIMGTWIVWGKRLAEMVAQPGPLGPSDVSRIADALAVALPPEIPGD